MSGGSRCGIATLILTTAALAGCGAGERPVAAAPNECVESWNAESTPLRFGRHVYDTHESHRAQVALLQPVVPNPTVAETGACAVIFAVPESDIEFGTVGLVMTDFGWASMRELARDYQTALDRIQGAASEAANATLLPDGKLTPN